MTTIEFTDRPILSPKTDKYKIIVRKEGLELYLNDENRCHFNYKNPVEILINQVIDMDTWKHSWHLDVSEIKRNPELKKKVKNIILKKVEDRKNEIELLESTLKVLNRWHSKTKLLLSKNDLKDDLLF